MRRNNSSNKPLPVRRPVPPLCVHLPAFSGAISIFSDARKPELQSAAEALVSRNLRTTDVDHCCPQTHIPPRLVSHDAPNLELISPHCSQSRQTQTHTHSLSSTLVCDVTETAGPERWKTTASPPGARNRGHSFQAGPGPTHPPTHAWQGAVDTAPKHAPRGPRSHTPANGVLHLNVCVLCVLSADRSEEFSHQLKRIFVFTAQNHTT